MIIESNSINFNQLPELARKNPRYATMFAGLAQIDNWVKNLVQQIISNNTDNPSDYYIKTALVSQCYTLYLYNSERKATVGVSWPLIDFLRLCETKTLEADVTPKVSRMIRKFGDSNLKVENENVQSDMNVNWIY